MEVTLLAWFRLERPCCYFIKDHHRGTAWTAPECSDALWIQPNDKAPTQLYQLHSPDSPHPWYVCRECNSADPRQEPIIFRFHHRAQVRLETVSSCHGLFQLPCLPLSSDWLTSHRTAAEDRQQYHLDMESSFRRTLLFTNRAVVTLILRKSLWVLTIFSYRVGILPF